MIQWQTYQGENLVLGEQDVHIWLMQLSDFMLEKTFLFRILSADEMHRADRFVQQEDGEKYGIIKALQRLILARYLNVTPASLEFKTADHGKPYLVSGGDLQFNLSHAGECVLLAVTQGAQVGVDIEKPRAAVKVQELVPRFFSEYENEQFSMISGGQQTAAFYRMWVKKEAFVKATGDGLSFPLSGFSVSLAQEELDQKNHLLAIHNGKFDRNDWHVQPLVLTGSCTDCYAALSLEGRPTRTVLGFLQKRSMLLLT